MNPKDRHEAVDSALRRADAHQRNQRKLSYFDLQLKYLEEDRQRRIGEIAKAVVECLAECEESEMPFTCLGERIERLRSTGWREQDIAEFTSQVTRALAELPPKRA